MNFLPRKIVCFRWIFAIAMLVLARKFIGAAQGDIATGFIYAILSIACLVSAAVAAAPEIVSAVTEPIGMLIDRIFLPTQTQTPPADYTLANLYRKQRRYDEAIEQYLKIIHYHPEEFDAYVGGIETALVINDTDTVRKLQRMALKQFPAEQNDEIKRVSSLPKLEES